MIRLKLALLFCIVTTSLYPQQGQLSISRIRQMPDLPLPFQIRDWKKVARDYDSFVFDLTKTGTYLPLSRMGIQGQFNYPGNTAFFLDSYVGVDGHLNQAEAINMIPAMVGATLAGIDKSNQDGINWVSKVKDFFNLKNGQNVYLNSYFTTSGQDWWYDIMPNVFFYQLRFLYPDAAPEFDGQFTSVADRWLECVKLLGGSTTPWNIPNMNYRAFNLSTKVPLAAGVWEPEAAGSIAWLLYNAYLETGNKKYFTGAQLAMDFLTGLGSNPSYELQLSYGTLVAARMNAVEGTDYPLQKLLDWCFNRGDLRGWGSIAGKWGDYDVSGLIGEANDGGNDYAFVMNGFQQAAALAPVAKYDKRYARDLAKWILNVTNASRLFYWNSLPQTNQDSYEWASINDPAACIPHESMKEIWGGRSPYATGDAIRGGWAATNLSLYSGSGVGYLAAVTDTTNIPGILQVNLDKTDFYGDNTLVSYLYFNPLPADQTVTVLLPPGNFGIYDAITETILHTTASGSIQLPIPAGEVRLIRLFPEGQQTEARDGRLYAGNAVLDYRYRYDYSANLRIKSLSADHAPISISSTFTAYCTPGNINTGDQPRFDWFLDDIPIAGQGGSVAQVTAPAIPSLSVLKCRVSLNGRTAIDTIHLQIVERIAVPPVVNGIQTAFKYTATGGSNTFTALVEPAQGEILDYVWTATSGILTQPDGSSVAWQAPDSPGIATISAKVTNQDRLSTTVSTVILVKDTSLPFQTPVIWYPFDTDDRNAAADRFHATAAGVVRTDDARGLPLLAYRFTTGQDIIYTDNADELNFTGAVSLSCWVKCEQLGSERFIISHGSWQQRYKLSITPEGRLRWTVKTNSGICDLDGSSPVGLNRYYHVTSLYTGYSMELYVDGILDTFKPFSGAILTSTKPLTIGRMDNVETQYAWRGSVDEVKVWDREIPVGQIARLKDQWVVPAADSVGNDIARIWPNPAEKVVNIEFTGMADVESISLFTADGRKTAEYQYVTPCSEIKIEIPPSFIGLHLLRIIMKDGRIVTRKVVIQRKRR